MSRTAPRLLAASAALLCLGAAAPAHASTVLFITPDGLSTDVTAQFAAGTAAAPARFVAPQDGALLVGEGTWFARIEADGVQLVVAGDRDGAGSTLDAAGAGPVVDATMGADVRIDAMTLTGGRSGWGGGLRVERARALVVQSTIEGNDALNHGGGIGVFADSAVTLLDSTIRDNTASASGGGIAIAHKRSTVVGVDVDIVDNVAAQGGGVATRNGRVELYESALEDNVAYGRGGGVWNHLGTTHIDGGHLVGNRAAADGGGIFQVRSAVQAVRTTLSGNVAARGGGWSVHGGFAAADEVSFTDNQATEAGGAVRIPHGDAMLVEGMFRARGCTFERNEATQGGAISGADGAQVALMAGTILRDNQAVQGGGVALHGAWLLGSGSLLADNAATAGGGGMFITESGAAGSHVELTDFRLEGNEASHGGGVLLRRSTLRAVRAEVVENEATAAGGGIRTEFADLVLADSEVDRNRATGGAGLHLVQGTTLLDGITATSNRATGRGGAIAVSGGTVSGAAVELWSNGARIGGGVSVAGGGVVNLSETSANGNTASGSGPLADVVDGMLGLDGGWFTGHAAGALAVSGTAELALKDAGFDGQAGDPVSAGGGPGVGSGTWIRATCDGTGCVAR